VTWYQFHIGSSAAQWNLRDGIWVDVLALSLQPNQWGGKFAYQGEGVLSELRVEWMRGVTELAFSTGLRWANLIGLEWSQVDLVRKRAWIHPDQAKAAKPVGVPLNAVAVDVIRRQIGRYQTFAFLVPGGVGRKLDHRQWKKAYTRAGIEDFRFHAIHAAHRGKLARAKRHAAECAEGAGRLGAARNGFEICPPCARPSGTARRVGHVLGTRPTGFCGHRGKIVCVGMAVCLSG
jgi:hypothetical protein